MSLFVHVLKRLLLASCGYLAALVVGMIAVGLIYGALSNFPGAPDYFAAMSLGPFLMLMAPPIASFIILLAFIVTVVQTLITTLISEFFSLRSAWIHMLFGAIVAASGYSLVMPVVDEFTAGTQYVEIGAFALSGLVGGLVYWLIAGRNAGFRRPLPPAPPFSETADGGAV